MYTKPLKHISIFKKTVLTVMVCLYAGVDIMAQSIAGATTDRPYYFTTYGRRDGLSNNSVNNIIQDKLGFIWISTKDGLNRFDGVTFRVFNKENSGLGYNGIASLLESSDGKLWVGTDKGVYIFDHVTETFTPIKEYTKSDINITHTVTHILEDAHHNIWFSADQEGLYCFNTSTRRLSLVFRTASKKHMMANICSFFFANGRCYFGLYGDNLYYTADNFRTVRPFKDKDGSMPFSRAVVTTIKQKNGDLYFGSSNGMYMLPKHGGQLHKLFNEYVRTAEFSGQDILAGTEKGLVVYNTATGAMNKMTTPDVDDPYSLTDNAIYTVFKDRNGGIWIGSYFGGVNYYSERQSYFEKFYPHEGMEYMGRRVREFCKSNDGTIWVGTEDKGLFNFDPRTRRITPFSNPKIYSNIHGLCLDGNSLWVGTFSGGLNRIDLSTLQVRNYPKGDTPNTLPSDGVFNIYKTRAGQLWIGTISGLVIYNRATDSFTRVPALKEYFVDNILEDKNGNMWIATYVNGLFRYNPKTKKWRNYRNKPDDDTSLPYDKVINLFQDRRGRLWIMTEGGGFCQYLPKEDKFVQYDMSKGLPSNIVLKMVEDRSGLLWISTSNGLVCFNPNDGSMKTYTTADGLLSNQFNYQSGIFDADNGMIYMGCIKGFIGFNPTMFGHKQKPSPVYFTELYLFNKHVEVGAKDSPLQKSLLYTDKVTLAYDQNSIVVEVANLDYKPREKGNTEYKMEGLDNEWHRVSSDGLIYFSNLPYRSFTLKIRGLDSEGKPQGTERSLKITVRPPFYLSGWAYTFYLMLIAAGAVYVFRRAKERIRRNQELAMSEFERSKERELYQSKISFFTNITHEIRTPLTLIKGPLDNILSHFKDVPDKLKGDLKVLDKNTDRLLELVNQLLDFRKAEQNGMKLNFVHSNISSLLRQLCDNFRPTLEGKGIKFDVDIPEGIEASVDTEAFTKIVSNLLSNAMKHAERHMELSVVTKDGRLIVTTVNDGEIIPMDMREKIFEPFIQFKDSGENASYGTGLGLTLARSLAELHHGSLTMDKDESVNRFVLKLPLEQATEIKAIADETAGTTVEDNNVEEEAPTTDKRYTVLVVEDNSDLRAFIAKIMKTQYNVLTAADGVKATEVLKTNVVNLIISDIMMPNMDGIELCSLVKSTVEFSHIPVILLTAKTAIQSKIEGSKSGADAYIEKPFSVEYLKAETENLLKNREQLRKLFTNSPFTQTNSVSATKTDNEFLRKIHQTVMENLSNADFSLDDLASAVNMSKSSLNRKFRGLLDITPNDYIRIERLKQAAIMLKEHTANITEVCYKCGFNTPSYFTKCFNKQFGVLPKDFVSKNE